MMAEYTKGPWELESESLRGDSYTGINGEGWYELATVVTRMQSDGEDNPEGLANARLIAAAPELLTSLSEIIWRLDRMDDLPEDLEEITETARVAIEKAKGQA